MKIFTYYKNLISDSEPWVTATVAGFFTAAFIGISFFFQHPEYIEKIASYFQSITGSNPQTRGSLALLIFRQNLITTFVALFGGMLFGLAPAIIISFNGFLFGFVVTYLFKALNHGFWKDLYIVAITLLPHGILELSIVFAASAFGIRWGIEWVLPGSRGKRKVVWKANLLRALAFIPLLVVVLAIAAVMEAFVSSHFAAVYIKK